MTLNSGTARALTVLLAEDEPLLRQIASEVLRKAGYVVLEAESSESALVAVSRNGGADLLISDLQLPEIGGFRLCEELRKTYPEIRVVFVSGTSREEVLAEAPLPSGAAFVEKPFEFSTFLAAVREVGC